MIRECAQQPAQPFSGDGSLVQNQPDVFRSVEGMVHVQFPHLHVLDHFPFSGNLYRLSLDCSGNMMSVRQSYLSHTAQPVSWQGNLRTFRVPGGRSVNGRSRWEIVSKATSW